MKKKIIILGSTGSIGKSTFEILKKRKRYFDIKLLSTNKNLKLLIKQSEIFNVKHLIINDFETFLYAKKKYKKKNLNFYNSFSIIKKLFKENEIFYSMIAIVGLEGLLPTMQTIKFSQNIAITNKESLICGWRLIKKELKKYNVNFFPVDSEHFSVFSLIKNYKKKDIDMIYLTASGGPFLNLSNKNLNKIKLADALKHPNWSMGKKISIDSATMMNKLFEVIEARNIFHIPYKNIKVLIHPKSYVHALVKFKSGFTKILLHDTNMKIPIHNSIYHDTKLPFQTKSLNLKILNNLDFQKINLNKFPLIKILKILPKENSLYETALITINDYFVLKFIEKKIEYKNLITSINYFARKKIFLKFRNKIPINTKDIYETQNYVNEKLNKLCI
jgi:1-deoxy-D-xylulose-5-phosphate reductoisomerase